MTCDWCSEPAVKRIEIEPAVFDKASGKTIRRAKVADVCPAHLHVRDRKGGEPLPDMRRRKAKGVVQTSIFDFVDGPTDAIRGG